ncbi:MAG: hypothetical protein WC428_01340 [Candidatus Paceibacterota bacterium]
MPKTKLSDILKHGKNFKVKILNPDDPEVIEMFRKVKEEQEKCLARKKIDWEKMRNTVINI